MNKKILLSFLLVVLIAISAGAVSAAEADVDVLGEDAQVAEVADASEVEEVGVAEEPVLGAEVIVDGDDGAAIQTAINNASAGDTINLGKDKVYTLNDTVTVNKKLNFVGNNVILNCNATPRPDNGYIYVVKAGSGSTFFGLTMNNLAAIVKYTGDDTLQGWGIYIQGATNCVVDNCTFWDWNHAVRIQKQANYNIVQNCFFYGGTATFINNLPNGAKDRGTYHIGIMGSTGNIVQNNSFIGPACDAVSIASGSGGNNVIGNYFEGNAYSIYFGGDSTKNTLLANNTFVNCGAFEADVWNYTIASDNVTVIIGEVVGHVKFEDLPVISVQKSADGFTIFNNTFYARTGNILIAAQESSTAHGAPSDIGNFSITDNTIIGLDENVVMHTVILCYIESNLGTLNPTGTMKILNNTLNGAMTAYYWSNDWGYNKGDVEIAAAKPMITIMSVDSLSAKKLVGTLKDINGKALTGETISYSIGGVNGTVETDENGVFEIEDIKGEVTAEFAGDSRLSEATVTCTVPEQIETVIEADNPFTRTAVDYKAGERGYMFYFTLKDTDGKALANKKVKIGIDGKTYTVTTDKDGKAGQMINMPSENSYTYALCFLGDEEYKASFTVSRLIVVKKAVTITPAKTSYTFKSSAKTKTITATLKSTNSYIPKGKQVTLTIAGKTFKATIGDKGQISLNIGSITAKGTYKVTIKYAGNPTYAAATSSTITVKIS